MDQVNTEVNSEEQNHKSGNSKDTQNNDYDPKNSDSDFDDENTQKSASNLREEGQNGSENGIDSEIDDEIDEAMDEGYMGMECTLERGFSLNESSFEKNKNNFNNTQSPNYAHRNQSTKYSSALKHLIPVRCSVQGKDVGHKMKVDESGLLSFISFQWMTALMWKAFKTSLKEEDIPRCSEYETSNSNIQRLSFLWEEEVQKKGIKNAKLYGPVWKFVQTRILCSMSVLILSLGFGFIGPTFFMRFLIDWLSTEEPVEVGIIWVVGLISCEAMRILLFGFVWALNYRTAIRLRAACLGLVYKKLMKMSSLGSKSAGEVVNLFANDGQRIYDFVVLGTFFLGGPIVAVGCVVYIFYILGPWAILGMSSFLIFYPCQYVISRLSGYLRRKTVSVTDERVRLITEIFACIKFIKLYAWEKCFLSSVSSIRRKEKKYLEKAAYMHSLSIALTPVVPVLAAIITFLVHIGAGNNLTAAQGFSVIALCFGEVRKSLANVSYSTYVCFQFLVTLYRLQGFSIVTLLLGYMRMSLNMMNYSLLAIAEGKQSIKRMQGFTLLSVMVRLRGQLHYLPYSVLSLIDCRIALTRFKNVLCMEEIESYIKEEDDKEVKVSLKEASFSWKSVLRNEEVQEAEGKADQKLLLPHEGTETEVLQNINLQIKKGELIGVCGGVGAGKSSLLLGILGQLSLRSGLVTRKGQCAYVGQESWILNATLRDNILLGESFEPKRYYRVMYACNLAEDVALLPKGEYTEIGERGVTLSGGQKQRLSLARALYANKDIYLLDDCLSAVDAHVGKHIFHWVLKKALKNKAVIFVTHQLQYLPECDRIIELREGRVVEMGTYLELTARGQNRLFDTHSKNLEWCGNEELLSGKSLSDQNSSEMNVSQQSESVMLNNSKVLREEHGKTKLEQQKSPITPDENVTGNIPASVYHKYITACGGYVVVISVAFTFFLNAASSGFGSLWLSIWLNAGSGNTTITVGNETIISPNISDNPDINYYKLVYGLSIIFILMSSLVRGFAFMKTTIKASSRIHNAALENLFRAPMHFFDTTPSGRVINLFSRDMDEVDIRLPITMETFLQNILIILIALIFVSIIFPYILIFLIFVATFFLFIRHVFKCGIRELKRHESIARSPIFSHINTTVNGLSYIQAFEKQEMFMQRYMQLYDNNSSAFYLFNCGTRWLAIRLDFLALSVTTITAFLSVALRSSVGPASVGLALAYASQLSGIFQYTVRLSAETEARFTSVQRLISYKEALSPEAPLIVKENRPSVNWPNYGRISFKKVVMRYGTECPLALKGITFNVDSLEKIGVIGRTGSGKSSIGVALFRLVEIEEGTIHIDGVNISKIGLEDLRSRLSIIPQDPILFMGTIRRNLDPLETHSDSEIWDALKKTRMADAVSNLVLKLDSPVVENGANFSVGEKQLLCMARALLRGNKILFLDEATAGIDSETDSKIQETLKEAFENCTTITVAHRLNTIMRCSRVIVVSDGAIVEFDTPESLMKNSSTRFYEFVTASHDGGGKASSSS